MTQGHTDDRVVVIDYTNHRGERSTRRIIPDRVELGSNEWHPERQLLLHAYDLDRDAVRLFAVNSIHAWDVKYGARVSPESFQDGCARWSHACFGADISADVFERNHRFIEEALELVQANGCTRSEAHQLVDYVYGRPVGEPAQEVGGVMVTLALLCQARGLDHARCGADELARVWKNVPKIRAKQAAKPRYSPLPGASS